MVANEPLEPDDTLCDRTSMVRAARSLLNSVTRVLLLADIVVVKQLLLAKDKVSAIRSIMATSLLTKLNNNVWNPKVQWYKYINLFVSYRFQIPKTLSRLESVANFTEFVKAFSVFGAEMVELAHVTCELLSLAC